MDFLESSEITTVDDYKAMYKVGDILPDGAKVIAVNAIVSYEYALENAPGDQDWYSAGQMYDMYES